MKREEIVVLCDREVLYRAASLFGIQKNELQRVDDYEGAANLVYEFEKDGNPLILRISYTPDRNAALIQAELHFVNFLADGGMRVSQPIHSINNRLVETINAENIPFHIVAFTKGKGIRVPDNGYRYREDAPIEEYFQNWGQTLGQMHALTSSYQPPKGMQPRPDWFELNSSRIKSVDQLPGRLEVVRQHIHAVLDEIESLPRQQNSFGLIHADFNDGNFTVDYSNGDITVFDFDDCCYFWFIYELASAWEGGIGRIMFSDLEKRRTFMDHYMEQLMEGYQNYHNLTDEWLVRMPLFIKLIQMEEFLHYAIYLDEPDDTLQAELQYKIKCIEDEIPYMGFFDSIYSPEKPFSL